MPEIEDPITTLVRLLDKNMRVMKEDGSLASVHVSPEWYDWELLRHYDGQVTVGLDRSEDQKLGFLAASRRRVGYSRVNVWVIDKPGSVVGRTMRNKLREEVNRVIREKRTKPNLKVGMPKRYSKKPACYVAKKRTIHVSDREVLSNPRVVLHEFYHHLRNFKDAQGGIEKYAQRFAENYLQAYRIIVARIPAQRIERKNKKQNV